MLTSDAPFASTKYVTTCIGFGVRQSGPFSCYSSRLPLRKDGANPFPSQKLEKRKGKHSHYSPVNPPIGQATSWTSPQQWPYILLRHSNCLKCQPFSLFPSDKSQIIPLEADPFQVHDFTVIHGTDLHFSVDLLQHLGGRKQLHEPQTANHNSISPWDVHRAAAARPCPATTAWPSGAAWQHCTMLARKRNHLSPAQLQWLQRTTQKHSVMKDFLFPH